MSAQTDNLSPTRAKFAESLKHYRSARRMSQLDLALSVDVSARHLSFLETGRAQPSREMVIRLCEGLTLPFATRNELLQAAGFSGVYPASPLDSETLRPFKAILEEMMARHTPYPAMVCDRHWNVCDANETAQRLLAPLQGEAGETNLIRMITDNPLATSFIGNYDEVLTEMTARIAIEALEAPGDAHLADLKALLDKAKASLPQQRIASQRRPLMPLVLDLPLGRLSFLSTIAHFGTSEDVTIRDLRLELMFPADEATREVIRQLT